MEKRFFRYYPFLSTVAASAVAVFILCRREIFDLSACNLFATLIIYYNDRVQNAPAKEINIPGRVFFAVI